MSYARLLHLTLIIILVAIIPNVSVAAIYSGVVIDSTGAPISDAVIKTVPDKTTGIPQFTKTSSIDGKFEISDPDNALLSKSLNCWITAPGYAMAWGILTPDTRTSFSLQNPIDIISYLHNENGKPVPNILLAATSIAVGNEIPFSFGNDPEKSPLIAAVDEFGQFRFPNLPEHSRIHVTYLDKSLCVPDFDMGNGIPIPSFQPLGSITGKVSFKDGRSTEGLQLIYEPDTAYPYPIETTIVKHNGTYAISQVLPGAYRLKIQEGLVPGDLGEASAKLSINNIKVDVTEKHTTNAPDIVLCGGALITGTVRLNNSNTPVPGIQIATCCNDTSLSTTTVSDSNGHYAIWAVAGQTQLSENVLSGDYITNVALTEVLTSEGSAFTENFKVSKGYPAKLHIVDENGKVPQDLLIRPEAITADYRMPPDVYTSPDSDGYYELHRGSIGSYKLQFDDPWTVISGGTITLPATQPFEIVISQNHLLKLNGRIIAPDGSGISGVSLKFRPFRNHTPQEGGYQQSTSDAEGRFTINNINPDDYINATITKPGYALISGGSIIVKDGAATIQTPIMAKLDHDLIGVVKNTDGHPVAGAWVVSSIGGPDLPIKTDSSGHFKMSGLPNCEFDLIAAKGTDHGRVTIEPKSGIIYANVELDTNSPLPKPNDTARYFSIMEKLVPTTSNDIDNIYWNSIARDLAPYAPDTAINELINTGNINSYSYFMVCSASRYLDSELGARTFQKYINKLIDPWMKYDLATETGVTLIQSNPHLAMEFYNIAKPLVSTDDSHMCGADLVAMAYGLKQPDADKMLQRTMKLARSDKRANSGFVSSVVELVAQGDWNKATELYTQLADIDKSYFRYFAVTLLLNCKPYQSADAFKSMLGLSELSYADDTSIATQIRIAKAYARLHPKVALAYARTFPHYQRAIACALAAVADSTPMPDATAIYNEAFDAGSISDQLEVANHAWNRDKGLGLSLFQKAMTAISSGASEEDYDFISLQPMVTKLRDELAWYYAKIDSGYGRALIEKTWSNDLREIQTVNATYPDISGSYPSETHDPLTTKLAYDATAMAAISIDDALGMAEQIPGRHDHVESIHRIAMYAYTSQEVRDHIDFTPWADGTVQFPGAIEGKVW